MRLQSRHDSLIGGAFSLISTGNQMSEYEDRHKKFREMQQAAMIMQLDAYIMFLEPYVKEGALSGISSDELAEVARVMKEAWSYLAIVSNSGHRKTSSKIDSLYRKLKDIVSQLHILVSAEQKSREKPDPDDIVFDVKGPEIPPFIPDKPDDIR